MKKAIIVAILGMVFGCEYHPEQIIVRGETEREASERVGYSPKTDAYINGLLDTKPISTRYSYNESFDIHNWEIKYEDLLIRVDLRPQKEYSNTEDWDFFANRKDGGMVMIDPSHISDMHRVSPTTIDRIKAMCFKIHKP